MKLNDMIKKSFGEKFKIARKNAGYSRSKLSQEIKVSAKTIQSWEDGRTYLENMGLIPIIEKRLGFFVPKVLGDTVREEVDKIKRIKKKLKAQKEEKEIKEEKEDIVNKTNENNQKQENKEVLEKGDNKLKEATKESEENIKKENQISESKEEEKHIKHKNIETSNVSSFLK